MVTRCALTLTLATGVQSLTFGVQTRAPSVRASRSVMQLQAERERTISSSSSSSSMSSISAQMADVRAQMEKDEQTRAMMEARVSTHLGADTRAQRAHSHLYMYA